MNDTGREQADKVGKSLKSVEFDAFYSSDLKRCKQTSKHILDNFTNGISVNYTNALRERNMGALEGLQYNDALALANKEGKTFHDYGEEPAEFVDKIQKMINHVLTESKEKKNILLVSHGGTIRTLLKILNYNKDLIVYNTSVTIVDFDKRDFNKFDIKAIGDTTHLGKGEFLVTNTSVR